MADYMKYRADLQKIIAYIRERGGAVTQSELFNNSGASAESVNRAIEWRALILVERRWVVRRD